MSRSGYVDDMDDQWALIRWRGAVASAIRGKRGQAFLREMLAALDAIESRRLAPNVLEADGEVCAIGAVGRARGINMESIDPEAHEIVASTFGIPDALACEIMFENDEVCFRETPEERYARIRKWVESKIRAEEIA